jgi:protein SCO1/2
MIFVLSPAQRKLGLALAVLLLLGGLFLAVSAGGGQVFATTISPHRPLSTLNSTLITADGETSLAALRGNIVVLYLGYTNCPDVCPTTLAGLKKAISKLSAPQAEQVKVIFITVDPQRDTPDRLKGYASAFNPGFIGANAVNKETLDTLVSEVGAFYQFGEVDENGYYPVDHSTSTIVLDREGQLMAYWQYGTDPSQIASDLKQFLR